MSRSSMVVEIRPSSQIEPSAYVTKNNHLIIGRPAETASKPGSRPEPLLDRGLVDLVDLCLQST